MVLFFSELGDQRLSKGALWEYMVGEARLFYVPCICWQPFNSVFFIFLKTCLRLPLEVLASNLRKILQCINLFQIRSYVFQKIKTQKFPDRKAHVYQSSEWVGPLSLLFLCLSYEGCRQRFIGCKLLSLSIMSFIFLVWLLFLCFISVWCCCYFECILTLNVF